jgi:hypothetical protein
LLKFAILDDWRQHSQVVRQRSAKPPSPSSNLGAAFNQKPCIEQGFIISAED